MKHILGLAGFLFLLAPPGSSQEADHGHGHSGIRVESALPGSPAQAAGVEAGDRLRTLAGVRVKTLDQLNAVLDAHRPGDTVTLVVVRNGEEIELSLTFGERPDGGVSIGVRLELPDADDAELLDTDGSKACLKHLDETYRVVPTARELGLAVAEEYDELRRCVKRDATRMSSYDAVRYCDNVFKVHCSGVDLLTEIGEALIARCETVLSDAKNDPAWKTCGKHQVFESYSKDGTVSDAAACRRALETCAARD